LPSNRPNGCRPTPMIATSFMRRVYRNCNSYSNSVCIPASVRVCTPTRRQSPPFCARWRTVRVRNRWRTCGVWDADPLPRTRGGAPSSWGYDGAQSAEILRRVRSRHARSRD
jgi:hypothetical protein